MGKSIIKRSWGPREDMILFRIGIYQGASGEGEVGGFTIKSLHILKENCPLSICSGVLLVHFSAISLFGRYPICSVISDQIKNLNMFATKSSRVGIICICFLN